MGCVGRIRLGLFFRTTILSKPKFIDFTMSLSYGLNITKKQPSLNSRPQPAKRKTIFDDDSGPEDGPDDEDRPESIDTVGGLSVSANAHSSRAKNGNPIQTSIRPSKTPQVSQYGDLSAHHSSSKQAKSAQSVDPSIYDYDSVYDSLHSKPLSSSAPPDQEKRPKYMTNLLAAAETRKRDQLRAKEKMLAKEREAEGDEFADKEKFVTAAYKRQQEEMRRLEEEEAIREKEAEERKRREGGGLKGLYKNMLDRGEQKHAAVVKAVEEAKTKGAEDPKQEKKAAKTEPSEMEIAKEKGAIINEDGQVVDKRQLLNAGLNAAVTTPKPSSSMNNDNNNNNPSGARSKGAFTRHNNNNNINNTSSDGGRNESARDRETRLFEERILGKRSFSTIADGDGDGEDGGGGGSGDDEDRRAAKSRKLEEEILRMGGG